MTRPATGTLLRGSAPALGGVVLGGILQAADPRLRLYVAVSPALVAVLAGLAGAPRRLRRLRRPARRPCGRWPKKPPRTGSGFSCAWIMSSRIR